MLAASSLVLTTIVGVPRGEAKLFKRMGTHLVEDITNLAFRADRSRARGRSAFGAACDRLVDAGYQLAPREEAWPTFEAARATYADRLQSLATYLATPSAQWLRDPLAPRPAPHRRAAV